MAQPQPPGAQLPEMQAAWQRLEDARTAVLESPTLLPSLVALEEWRDARDAVEAVVARLVSVFWDRASAWPGVFRAGSRQRRGAGSPRSLGPRE